MGLGLLIVCLVAQFSTKRYIPVVYWLTVTAVSIFGTMSADFLNQDLGMPLWASTAMLLVLQAGVFIGQRALANPLGNNGAVETRTTSVSITFSDQGANPTGTMALKSNYGCSGGCPQPSTSPDSVSCDTSLNFWGKKIDVDNIAPYQPAGG